MQAARLRRYFLFLLVVIGSNYACTAFAQDRAIPTQVSQTLDSLKKSDSLTEWLYLRIDHSYNSPGQSLSFLMSTQKEVWRKPGSTVEKEAWLMLLSNQAYNLLYTGNILESIEYYEQSYNYYIDHKLNVGGIAEYIFKPWANNYTRLGDYEKALFIQKRTLDYALKEKDQLLAASTYNNMAISYRSLGDFRNAEQCIQMGLQGLGQGSQIKILLNNTLADVYKDSGRNREAERVITENILFQRKQVPDFETAYWLLSSYITAGDIQLAKGNFASAKKQYEMALGINDKYYNGNRRREEAYVITQLGNLQLKQHQPAKAIGYFNSTLSILGVAKNSRVVKSKLFGDNRLVDVLYLKGMAALQLGDDEAALENIQLSLLAADKIRFELADVKTKQRFQADTKEKAEQAMGIAFRLLEETQQYRYALIILDIMEQSKARTLLEDIRKNQQQLTLQTNDTLFVRKQELEKAIAYNERELLQHPQDRQGAAKKRDVLKFRLGNVEKALRDKYPSMGSASIGNAPLNISAVLKKMPYYGDAVQFFLGQDFVYVLQVKNRQIRHIHRISNAEDLKQRVGDFVKMYYHNGPEAMMHDPKAFYSHSYYIYNSLLGMLDLGSSKQIILIPDEVVGYLSFDGLVTNNNYRSAISTWPFLIKSAKISYAFSLKTLINQSHHPAGANQDFAGLFITHQNKGKQFIPAVAREAASIKKLVSGSFLVDEEAGTGNFLKAFDKASVLHISTHSYLSGVQKEPALAFDDKEIFLFELSARKHAPALVVLSACQTADGMVAKGEGIISLSRGFAAIGAQATIAGLWNVNDEAASVITAGMYQNIVEGNTPGLALHQAKLQWLAEPRNGEQNYLPYYWDALIFMGYDQQLLIKPATRPVISYLIYTGLAALLLLTIWFVLKRLRLRAVYLSK